MSFRETLQKLPFRLVIFRILCFYEVRLNFLSSSFDIFRDIQEELDMFGYFKADPTRKIFFLFPSLHVYLPDERKLCRLLAPGKVISLRINNVNNVFINELIPRIGEFKNAENLSITLANGMTDHTKNFFSNPMFFPELKHLEFKIKHMKYHEGVNKVVDSSLWFQEERIWKKLESLSFSVERFMNEEFPLVTHENLFHNLKKITLICVLPLRRSVMKFPNILEVKIVDCRNIIIQGGINPYKLALHQIHGNEVREMIELGNQFTQLYVDDSQRDVDNFNFLMDPGTIRKQEYMRKIHIYNAMFSGPIDFVCDKNVEDITLGFCRGLSDRLFHQNFSKLKRLSLYYIRLHALGVYPFCGHLVELSLESEKLPSNDFFTQNSWKELKFLTLSYVQIGDINKPSYTTMWKMPKLEMLDLEGLETQILSDQSFPSLNILHLTQCEVNQFVWDKTSLNNLKELRLNACGLDRIFVENDFCVLGRLSLLYCDEVEGRNWRKIPRLRRMRIYRCAKFGDELFQGDCVINLRILQIQQCSLVKKENWVDFEKMEIMEID